MYNDTCYIVSDVRSVKTPSNYTSDAYLKPVTRYLLVNLLADILFFRSAAFLYLIVQQVLKYSNKYSAVIKGRDIEIVVLFNGTEGGTG